MSQSRPAPVAYVLVETGMHSGARLELREPGTWYSVGGLVDADYWLADPDLAEAKLEFAFIGGSVRVRVHSGPAASLENAVLDVGAEGTVRRTVLWGGVSLRAVTMPAEAAPPASAPANRNPAQALRQHLGTKLSRRAAIWLLASLAVIVPLGLMLATLTSMLDRFDQQDRQAKAIAAQSGPDMKRANARAAAQRLADLISIRTVSVTAIDGETLALFGTNVPPEHREAILAAISQFEPSFTVRDNIAYRDDQPVRPVELSRLPEGVDFVHFGSEGFLRSRAGNVYLLGGKLPDGTQVELIGSTEIWLSRGNERSVLRAPAFD
jgi:hypothetical protein